MCSQLSVLEVFAVRSSVMISSTTRTDSRQQPSGLFYVHTEVLHIARVIVLALLATYRLGKGV